MEAPGRRGHWDVCAWGESKTSSASSFEKQRCLFGMLMGYAFCLQKRMILLQRIKSFPTPIQVFPVVLSNLLKTLSELIFTFKFGKRFRNPEGHRKGRKRKADQVKKGQMRRSSKVPEQKRKGRQSKQGRECGPKSLWMSSLQGWNLEFQDTWRTRPDHIAMSVLPVVLTQLYTYREDIYCRQWELVCNLADHWKELC